MKLREFAMLPFAMSHRILAGLIALALIATPAVSSRAQTITLVETG